MEERDMLFYDNNTNYREEIKNYWNKNVKRYRNTALIAGIILLLLGILCCVFPVRSILVMEYIASFVLIIIGFFEIYGFSTLPIFLKTGGGLLTGILNVILGILLITSPKEEMMQTFAFLFAIDLMMFGIENCVAYSRTQFFGIQNSGWLLAEGVLNIALSIVFLFMPVTTIALSYVVAVYLIAAGIMLLYSFFSAKEIEIRD